MPSLPSHLQTVHDLKQFHMQVIQNTKKKNWESKKPSPVRSMKNTTKAKTTRVVETALINIKNCSLHTGGVSRSPALLRARDKTSTERRWKRTKIIPNILSQLMIANLFITKTRCILCFPNTPDACHKNQRIRKTETFFEPRASV